MFDFTPEDLQHKVREVAADYPKYVYDIPYGNSCMYFHKGDDDNYSCGCIIGHALHRLGVTLEDISEEYNFVGVWGLLQRHLSDLPLDFNDATVQWLSNVQSAQDRGETWSSAVKKADNGHD